MNLRGRGRQIFMCSRQPNPQSKFQDSLGCYRETLSQTTTKRTDEVLLPYFLLYAMFGLPKQQAVLDITS